MRTQVSKATSYRTLYRGFLLRSAQAGGGAGRWGPSYPGSLRCAADSLQGDQGIRLLRVNNELVENDVEMVLDRIVTACGIVWPSPDLGEGQADVRQRDEYS